MTPNAPERSPQAAKTPQNAAQVLHTSNVIAPITQNPITVLAWHNAKIVGFDATERTLTVQMPDSIIDKGYTIGAGITVTRHDPHAAQHAETVRLLGPMCERLQTQDERMTENPMFCVQTRRKDVVPADFSEEKVWVLEGEEVDKGTEDAEEYGIRWSWETVMVAFTEEGCKEYIRQNGHNLSEPRIYVESFNRCPEMITIRRYLATLHLSALQPATAVTKVRETGLKNWKSQ